MADLKKLAEELVGLTLLEAAELKNILKDEYGIEPAAGAVAVAQVLALGHGGEGGGGAQAAVAHIVEQGGVRFGMGLVSERAIVGIGHG